MRYQQLQSCGNTSSVSFADSCVLRHTRSSALTVHRTVIHYRRLRFAYLEEKPFRLLDKLGSVGVLIVGNGLGAVPENLRVMGIYIIMYIYYNV